MKTFSGTPVNVEKTIVAKVSRTVKGRWLPWRGREPLVYVAETSPDRLPKASAYIFTEHTDHSVASKLPVVYGIPVSELNDGDVVMIEKDGIVKVLYEIASQQNVIFATNRCNLNCVMCPQPSKADEEGMLDNNLKLIRMMSPDSTKSIAISGGEPTLLGEGLQMLIKACRDNLPKTSLIVLTNGTRLKDIEFVRQLTMIGHPDLTFAIPLYSDIDTTHDRIVGLPGGFFEAINGLHNLALFRHSVEIRIVVNAMNYTRLSKLAEFIYRNFPFSVHVAIMALEMTGNAIENYKEIWIDPFDYTHEIEKAVRILNRAGLNVSLYNHQLCVLPRNLWRFSRQSISSWKNCYIDQCSNCSVREICGGFFQTSGRYISQHIRPIVNTSQQPAPLDK